MGWEADEYMHFLEAKTLLTNFPHNLSIGIGVWSKPGYIYIYGMLITIFNITSLLNAQIITIVIGLITSWLILKILAELKCSFKIQILGLILTNFSFLMFRGSLSIMTEPIFALFLTAGIYFLVKQKFGLSALMFGLLPLVRIEGLFFVALLIVYVIYKKKFSKIVFLITPTIIWNFLGFLMTSKFFYIVDSGYPLSAGKYSHGGYPYYVEGFMKIDPIIFVLFLISAVYIFRYFKNKQWVKFGVVFSFLLFLFLQIIFWKFGLFGTAGLMRYFVTVLPLAIISISLFFEHIFGSIKNRFESCLIVFVICVLQVFFTTVLFMRGGLVFNQQTRAVVEPGVIEAGDWVGKYVSSDTKVYSDVPEVIYFAGRDLNNSTIFGGHEAYLRGENAVYIFKKSTAFDNSFFDNLKGSEVVNFSNNVYVVTL
ncbi:MAG: hypothetical protein ACMG57_03265 [Candidatus Dojkabacteria bacterium]